MLGFAVNPLGGIEFAEVFASLGYETKPPKDFGFIKRNIHFSGACAVGAKQRISIDLQVLLGSALPDEPGMVRVCENPPIDRPQSELPYGERYFDVPAARFPQSADKGRQASVVRTPAPLVVPMDREYSPSGNGVVSNRTAHHVGFNGYGFRKLGAFPELRNSSSQLVRRAWPPGLIEPYGSGSGGGDPVYGSESIRYPRLRIGLCESP